MAVIDAASSHLGKSRMSCDVCIIGAGAAGLYLGVQLANRGLSVTILEAGGRVCGDGESVGFDAKLTGDRYRGVHEGRAFGLGGTTSRWGGVLVPHTEHDFRAREEEAFDSWGHIVDTVAEHSSAVLETLGLRSSMDSSRLARTHIGDELESIRDSGLDLQIAQYLPFRKKNLATLLDDSLAADENLTVLLNAVAKDWQFSKSPGGPPRASSVQAACGGRTVTVAAQSFVVAAGALESARILLEMDHGTPHPLFPEAAAVGHYLGDHLSCPIARVQPDDRNTAASLFQPRFASGRMYYFRLLEAPAPTASPRSFAHFIFENESPGFDLAKQVLQGWQARSFPSVSPSDVVRGIKGVLALGWDRFVNSKLHIPRDTPVRVQLDVEQHPSHSNQISLSDQKDEHGRPTPVIQWEVKDEDYEAIRRTARRFLERWPGSKRGVPALQSSLDTLEERKPHDAYHPVGVCRLGKDQKAVVTPQLRVRGVENLSVLSTAVFPTAGTANPTFSMLCFAEMLSARLQKEAGRNRSRSEVS